MRPEHLIRANGTSLLLLVGPVVEAGPFKACIRAPFISVGCRRCRSADGSAEEVGRPRAPRLRRHQSVCCGRVRDDDVRQDALVVAEQFWVRGIVHGDRRDYVHNNTILHIIGDSSLPWSQGGRAFGDTSLGLSSSRDIGGYLPAYSPVVSDGAHRAHYLPSWASSSSMRRTLGGGGTVNPGYDDAVEGDREADDCRPHVWDVVS